MVGMIASLAGRFILAPLAALWRVLSAKPTQVAVGALIALCGFLCLRLAMIDGDRDEWRDKAKSEAAAHEITLQSVKTLRDALDAKNAESLARAAALEKARQEAAQAQADAERQFRATQARIDALRAAVGKNRGDDCATPDVGVLP